MVSHKSKSALTQGWFQSERPRMFPNFDGAERGFEPLRPMDSGFRIHRNTWPCDLGARHQRSEIRVTGFVRSMKIEIRSGDEIYSVDSDTPISVGSVLDNLGIAHSTVLAVIGDTIIPHTLSL